MSILDKRLKEVVSQNKKATDKKIGVLDRRLNKLVSKGEKLSEAKASITIPLAEFVDGKIKDEVILNKIKGEKGDTGPQGESIQGPVGPHGDRGLAPSHEWQSTKLRIMNPDETWGELVDLQGKEGKGGQAMRGGGASHFVKLMDVPSTYSGQAGKNVVVKATEDGLEFSTSAGSGDVVGPAAAVDSNFAAFDTTTGKLIKDSGSKASDFAGLTSPTFITDIYTPVMVSGADEGNSATVNGSAITGQNVAWVDDGSANVVAEIGVGRAENTTASGGAVLFGARSRGTLASKTVVLDGDNLFDIVAVGHDGTDYAISSRIDMEVDGAPGANDMPGRIVFKVSPDGGQTPAEAMRISQDKAVTMASTLAVTGAITGSNLSGSNTGDNPGLENVVEDLTPQVHHSSGGRYEPSATDSSGHHQFTSGQTLNSASGTDKFFSIAGTINGSDSVAVNFIEINATTTAAGSGTQNLFSLQNDSVAKFEVDVDGNISTGTWQGAVIAEAYLQNQSGTNTGDEVVATGAEVDTGTNDAKMVTPKAVKDSGVLYNTLEDPTPELGGELDAGAHSIGFTMQTATGDGATTIDWKLGNHMDFTFGAFNETFTFTAPTNPGVYTLSLKQDSVGSRTATWPGTVKWAGGSGPTLTTTATTGYDIVSFRWDGSNYYAIPSLNFS